MDDYIKEIKTKIIESKKDYVILEKSIFHKSGGGQPRDKGVIDNIEIKKYDGEKFYLKKNDFKINQEVILKINWEYRYKLMKMHTAEHLLFACLKSINENINVEKIELEEDESSMFVNGKLNFEQIKKALILANEKINQELKVTQELIPLNEIKDVRIKKDRIKSDLVRVIRISDFDASACSGTHLKSIKEIEFLVITKINKVSEDVMRIFFKTGQQAKEYSISKSITALSLEYKLNEYDEKLILRIESIIDENNEFKEKLRKINEKYLNEKEFKSIKGIVFEEFEDMDNQKLIKKATELSKYNQVVFVNNSNIIIAGNKSNEIFNLLNENFQIKGGGRDIKIGKINDYDSTKLKLLLENMN